MTDRELKLSVLQLRQTEREIDRMQKRADELKDVLKRELESRKADALETEYGVIRYAAVSSLRFDTKAFRTAFTDLYNRFTRQAVTMRFTLT
jgi:predicted phage-related endonuclease